VKIYGQLYTSSQKLFLRDEFN